jgi:F-type H+-transporting ATPase subunit epsilon
MATLKLEIVTPEAKIYSEDVDMHIPLMTQVAAGEIVARRAGQDFFLAVGEGFVEITGERVAVLTDMAIKADDIDETKAEEARKRAEARLSEKLSEEETATVQAALLNSLTQLNVKRRHRS